MQTADEEYDHGSSQHDYRMGPLTVLPQIKVYLRQLIL